MKNRELSGGDPDKDDPDYIDKGAPKPKVDRTQT